MTTFIQYAVNGLLVGAVFALIALGFSLVWGILNIINLAHAAFIMLGAYFTWVLVTHAGFDPLLCIPVVMFVLFLGGYLLQRGLLNTVMRAPLLTTFLMTFGLETLIVNLGQRIWSANTRSVAVAYSGKGIIFGAGGVHIGRPGGESSVVVPFVALIACVIALALVAIVWLIVERTRTGHAIRAVGMDITAARLVGIDIAHTYAITFAISASLAGAAGCLIAISQGFSPASFGAYNIRAFVVVVLGGLGSIPGALAGGLLLGLLDQFSQAPLPNNFFFGWPSLARVKDGIFFLVLLTILIVRPTGLLGREGYR
jgi:branched-chain amino acid transport system permease protein